ncbi:MAG: hypothetical protein KAF91_26390 [Nostoc sp. TH1S01]|nr:hypothetical protein [Nostoc sp. TH1S01]
MISLIKQHWRLLACFLSGLILTVSLSLRIPVPQTANAVQPIQSQANLPPDFYSDHLEHNFYQ